MAERKKILFIVTSHDTLGDSGQPTGWYLPEVAHPYNILSKKFTIEFASPLGGKTPMDPSSLEDNKNDAECIEFLKNEVAMRGLNESLNLNEVNSNDYACVFYPGGHGPMYDLANNEVSHKIGREIYEKGGVVAAVCHGPAGFVNIKLSNGSFLIKGKRVAGFSNSEEDAVDKSKWMPFMLETQIVDNGGIYVKAENWAKKVVVDGRLISGQNPASASPVGQAIYNAL